VLRYWQDFIPSWAGAISIDLLPVVLVLVLMIVHDAMRREANSMEEAETITAAEMIRAVDLYRQMQAVAPTQPVEVVVAEAEPEPEIPAEAEPAPEVVTEPSAPDATVTPIDVRKRGEGPQRA
jgi:hypothetical protein